MKQRQVNDSVNVDEFVSDWWDDELSGKDARVDALLDHYDGVREKARLYELIGSRVRGEPEPSRDLLAGVDARLDRLPVEDRPGGKVASLDAARNRRRLIPTAVAASLVAGMAAVGLSLTVGNPSGNGSTLQATGPTENDRALMATLGGTDLPESASPAAAVGDPEATVARVERASTSGGESRLPAWASGSVAPDSDPYVITHYRAAPSEFGAVVPEVRAAAFERR
ncbi:MAG: hypothetical protein ACQER6_01255 [Pseudomonadota bacterium]